MVGEYICRPWHVVIRCYQAHGQELVVSGPFCCGHGIAMSAGIGTAMSGLLRGDTVPVDLDPYEPSRFGKINPFSPEFRDRCAQARASKSHASLDS